MEINDEVPCELDNKWPIFYKTDLVQLVVNGVVVDGSILEDQKAGENVHVEYLPGVRYVQSESLYSTEDDNVIKIKQLPAHSDEIWHIMKVKFWSREDNEEDNEWSPAYEIIQEVDIP